MQSREQPGQKIMTPPISYQTAGQSTNATAVQLENPPRSEAERYSNSMFKMIPHVEVSFEDTFREPETARGFETMRKVERHIYNYTHFIVYAVLTLILGPVLSFCWAILFAAMHIFVIWFIQPFIKIVFVGYRITSLLVGATIRLLGDPFFNSVALIFSMVNITTRLPESNFNVTVKKGTIQDV